MNIIKYSFQQHSDARGKLVAVEQQKDIPFEIKRVYYIYATRPDVRRGFHAHNTLEQVLICVHGSCKILLDDGTEKEIVVLDKPYEGLYVPKGIWREMYDFSQDAVLLVLASELYDKNDYIRDYCVFKSRDSNCVHGGGAIVSDAETAVSGAVKRLYYIYDTKPGVRRGFHAHKNLEQVLVCVHGFCRILLDDGARRECVTMEKFQQGLHLPKRIWHEMYDFSPDAVLLVLASDLYNEDDYIRNYDEFLAFVKGGQ